MSYQNVYEENKILDQIFKDKYEKIVLDYHEKNMLELLVELGEFANETRCFKYWSLKEIDKEKALYEYADCLLMILYLHNYLNVKNISIIDIENNNNIVEQFILVYELAIDVVKNLTVDKIGNLLSNFIYLGKLIGFNEKEIIEVSLSKINVNKERLNSDY